MDRSGGNSSLSLFQLLFSFKGRIDRLTFFGIGCPVSFGCALLFVAAIIGLGSTMRGLPGPDHPASAGDFTAIVVLFLPLGLAIWMTLALYLKRLHDRNPSFWFMFVLYMLPFVSLWILVETLRAGTLGPNRYGDGPLPVGPGIPPGRPARRFLIALAGGLLPLVLVITIRTFAFEPFNIPSGSMTPTLMVGDYVFVSKFSYGYSKYSFPFWNPPFSGRIFGALPKRGEVAVFRLPRDPSFDYVKRIIGLPGDRIQVTAGELYINGEAVPREQIADFPDDEYGEVEQIRQFLETLPGGPRYSILQKGDDSLLDNTQQYFVPDGTIFAIGDNRSNSEDSRALSAVGYIPLDHLVGRVVVRYFSTDIPPGKSDSFWLWPSAIRASRVLTTIR